MSQSLICRVLENGLAKTDWFSRHRDVRLKWIVCMVESCLVL